MDSATIVAIATPPGRGGIGIVRISGTETRAIAQAILGTIPRARQARHGEFRDAEGSVIDIGIALFFPAPHSFTGEDVLELHGHGGPVVLDLIMQRCMALGARAARPGEYSQRAFLNKKIDLAEAEAIADLIDSASTQAARLALRSLQGEFSRHVRALVDDVIRLRAYVESAIDFPEEEIDFLTQGQVATQLQALLVALDATLAAARQGNLLREGMTVVIAGRPNAGKSTLLNRLAGEDLAIVTDIPGTTRDVLRAHIVIDGLPVHIIDTAGLRDSADPIEQEGMRRAWAQIEHADRILLLIDDQCGLGEEERAIAARLPRGVGLTVVRNKIDLTQRAPGTTHGEFGVEIALSARNDVGTELLKQHLKDCMGYQSNFEGMFMARRRHIDALQRAHAAVHTGLAQLRTHRAGELLAEDLRAAQTALNEITGEFTADDLLGHIFSTFCIGK